MNKAVKYTYVTIGINLLVAILIYLWLLASPKNPVKDLVDFILSFPLNFAVGISALFISGYAIGNKMKSLICQRKWNSIVVGMIGLMIILICGVLGGSTITFLEERLMNRDSIRDAIVDYYFKPLFWILLFGFIPTIMAGAILGGQIKKIEYNS